MCEEARERVGPERGDPLHADGFHDVVFGTEEEAVKTVDDRYIFPACGDLEEEAREEEGEDGGHGAAEDTDEQAEE